METPPFNPGEVAEFAGPVRRTTEALPLFLHDGMPTEDGWYLVELDDNAIRRRSGQPFDVDYCRAQSPSDGGSREWVAWYPNNIKRWAKLPEKNEEES